jgi:hypothetical protein
MVGSCGVSFPGALPPAIEFIPCGDQGLTVLSTFSAACKAPPFQNLVRNPVLHYRRTFELKELSVPVSEAAKLQKFYRIIATDERNNAVLKLGSP